MDYLINMSLFLYGLHLLIYNIELLLIKSRFHELQLFSPVLIRSHYSELFYSESPLKKWAVKAINPLISSRFLFPNLVFSILLSLFLMGQLFYTINFVGWVVLLSILLKLHAFLFFPYGKEGADQFSLFIGIVLALLIFSPQNIGITLCFCTINLLFSYFVAGFNKLKGEKWRKGAAITEILRTDTYGLGRSLPLLEKHKGISKFLAWSVMIFEMVFPAVLLFGDQFLVVFLALGVLFHGANMALMGLNSFFWIYLSSYPLLVKFKWEVLVV